MEAEFYSTDTEHIVVCLCSCQQVAVSQLLDQGYLMDSAATGGRGE